MHLTERLSERRLEQMIGELKPGRKTALALDLMADLSSFLALPVNELPNNAPPDRATQRSMISGAINYTANTLQHLPNFLATRATRSFDDKVPTLPDDGGMLDMHSDLHLVDSASENITYRRGSEVAVARNGTTYREASSPGLWSTGEFGPTLAMILLDASNGEIVWSHWERTSTGLTAVFRYVVPAAASTYHLNYVGDAGDNHDNRNSYHGTPGYHGFLTIDPATGAVLRYTLECDLRNSDPIALTAVAVQYGKVLIGESSNYCPIRSVAVLRGLHSIGNSPKNAWVLSINEVTFTNYHRFGSTARVLPATPPQ